MFKSPDKSCKPCEEIKPERCVTPIFPENITVYERGLDGLSAYEIAVANGFVGTQAQWLLSLKGADGESAYQIWLDLGNTGTEQDFIDYLSAQAELSITDLTDVDIASLTGQDGKILSVEDGMIVLSDAPEAVTQTTITADVTVGAVSAGDELSAGMNIEELRNRIFNQTFTPTFTNPTFSLSNNAGLREVGQSANFSATFNFNRGSINGALVGGVWNPSISQNPRAGVATNYTFNYTGGTASGTSNIAGISGYVVQQGINTITATVTYAQGSQPIDSKGNNFDNPYPAGTSPVQVTTFEGVYPLFATTANITTITKQPLVSMLNGNNVQINLIGETGGNKQQFQIPKAWTNSRPLQSIQYFNTLNNQWDTTNRLSEFDTNDISQTIQGNSIAYTNYTYNGLTRGSVLIRLIF